MTGRRKKILLLGAALAGPLLAPAMAAPAWAQAGTTRTAALNVPAGPLETVLLAVGRQAGLHFAYDSSLTAGRRSAGVQGTLAPAQAVAQALAGTGLRYAFTGAAEVRIWAPAAAASPGSAPTGTVVLDQVTLQAGNGQTEGSGLYGFDAPTATATGLALTPRETPQSLSVATNQQIRDSGALNLKDTINQTPGVNAVTLYGDARWNFYARGSKVSNIQYDGATLEAESQENSPDDMVIYDRVEVVRGATGLMDGAGEPSASVNLVRKRPLDTPRTSIEAAASDYGRASLTLDASRPLNGDGSLRGRLLAYGVAGDTWREAQGHKTGLVYGALDIDLGPDTTLGLGLSYQDDLIDGYAWGGFWLAPDGSRYGFGPRDNPAAAWESLSRQETVAYADLTHGFQNGWTLKLTGRLADADGDRIAGYATWSTPDQLVHHGYLARQFEKSAIAKAVLQGEVEAFGRSHQLAFGADWRRVKYQQKGSGDYALDIADPSRPFTWADGRPDLGGPVTWQADTRTTQRGLFASGRFELNPALHLVAGGRLAWYDTRQSWGNPTLGAPSSSSFAVHAERIPYLGLVYDLTPDWTLYASHTGVFRPLSERDATGRQLDPATGTNTEIGAKASLQDGGMLASVALFDTTLDGLPQRVADSSQCVRPADGCYSAAETVRTRGVDVEVSGSPAAGWNLTLGYTYADSAYDAGPSRGQRYNPYSAPRHLAKLNASYAFGGSLQGLTLGGALRAQSGIQYDSTSVDGTRYRAAQGGYAVLDLMGRYDLDDQTAVQVNVDNLLDRSYLTGVDMGWPNMFFGQPRTVSLALTKSF